MLIVRAGMSVRIQNSRLNKQQFVPLHVANMQVGSQHSMHYSIMNITIYFESVGNHLSAEQRECVLCVAGSCF